MAIISTSMLLNFKIQKTPKNKNENQNRKAYLQASF